VSRTDKTDPAWVRQLHAYQRDEINHDHRRGECRVWYPEPVGAFHWTDYTCYPEGKSYYSMESRWWPRPSEFKFRQKQFSRKHRARLRNLKHLAKQVRNLEDFEDWDIPTPRHRHDAAWLVW